MDPEDDEIGIDPHILLRNDVGNVPLRALSTSTRTNLSILLDPHRPIPTPQGFSKNWQGVAELANYDHAFIMKLRREISPTQELLSHWEKNEDATIGLLLDILTNIGRFDIIDDLSRQFRNNANAFRQRVPLILEPKGGRKGSTSVANNYYTGNTIGEQQITVHDSPGTIQRYDAYVCYTEDDSQFVNMLVGNLQGEFKLCVSDRDLLPGCFEHSAIIELIQQRCEKFLVVLSPQFLASQKLEFQTMFAHACSLEERKRKVIPIIYEKCDVPSILKSLAKLDYTNNTFNNFWDRLKASLTSAEPFPKLPGSNSLPSLHRNHSSDENLSSVMSNSSGYSSFYTRVDEDVSRSSIGSEPDSTERSFNSNLTIPSPEVESISDGEIASSTKKKKKRRDIFNKPLNSWKDFKQTLRKTSKPLQIS